MRSTVRLKADTTLRTGCARRRWQPLKGRATRLARPALRRILRGSRSRRHARRARSTRGIRRAPRHASARRTASLRHRHRSARERRADGIVGRVVRERRCEPVRFHPGEAGLLHVRAQVLAAPELKEHRADVALHAAIDDRKDIRPATMRPRAHTATTARRPGFSTRPISRRAPSGSGTYISPRPQKKHRIERGRLEELLLGVRAPRGDVRKAARRRGRPDALDHPLGDVRRDDAAARTNGAGGRERDQAGSTRDVEPCSPGRSAAISSSRSCAGRSCAAHTFILRRRLVPPVSLHAQLQPRFHGSHRSGGDADLAPERNESFAKTSR